MSVRNGFMQLYGMKSIFYGKAKLLISKFNMLTWDCVGGIRKSKVIITTIDFVWEVPDETMRKVTVFLISNGYMQLCGK